MNTSPADADAGARLLSTVKGLNDRFPEVSIEIVVALSRLWTKHRDGFQATGALIYYIINAPWSDRI
jgi:hypothetical protein